MSNLVERTYLKGTLEWRFLYANVSKIWYGYSPGASDSENVNFMIFVKVGGEVTPISFTDQMAI